MSKITEMNIEAAKALNAEMEKAIQAVNEKFGLTLKQGVRGTYDPEGGTYSMRIIFQAPLEEGAIPADWKRYCWKFSMCDEDFGKQFTTIGGRVFEIVGLRPRARKQQILVQDVSTGGRYKMDAINVRDGLARERNKSA